MTASDPKPEPKVIHQLKNHLGVVIGFCDLILATSPPDDPRRADLIVIQQAARDAMGLMPDLVAKTDASR